MTQANVGFHCPDCIQAAPQPKLKAVRRNPERLTSYVLIGVNAVVWLAILLTGGHASPVLKALALIPQGNCAVGNGQILLTDAAGCAAEGFSWAPGVGSGAVWQPLTSAFTHVEPWHILFNMMALFILGPQVEYVLGRWRYLVIYFFSALMGSALVTALSAPFIPTVGASGAIFGLMGAFLVLALKRKSGLAGILVWLGMNAAITFTIPNVSWQGHLGGLLGGALITAVMLYLPPKLRKSEVALLVGLFVLVCATIAAIAVLRF